jgi:hypothetical protein
MQTTKEPPTLTHRLQRILAIIINVLVLAAILGIWTVFLVWLIVFAIGGGQ